MKPNKSRLHYGIYIIIFLFKIYYTSYKFFLQFLNGVGYRVLQRNIRYVNFFFTSFTDRDDLT